MIAWVLVAWSLPPLIAAALGWEGIWGSGSALVDYLIPVPVAGGAFHVPSFLICTLAVARLPSLGEVGASRVRAALLGITIAGVLGSSCGRAGFAAPSRPNERNCCRNFRTN